MNYLLVDWENLAEKKIAYKYPNVASEILSTMHDNIVNYFLILVEGKPMAHFERLLQFFSPVVESDVATNFNFTRASYVCKILNNLVLHKSGAFINHLLGLKNCIRAIMSCCHSKSVSGLLLNIVTLIPSSQQSPLALTGNMPTPENKSDPNSNPQNEVLKETFEKRLEIFDEIIQMCIGTQLEAESNDLHANLANVIMIVLNKDFTERINFMKVTLDRLSVVLDQFAATFDSFSNNKLGNIFLVLLEVLFKDGGKETSLADIKIPCFNHYIELYFKLLRDNYGFSFGKPSSSRLTPSFSCEIQRLNPKVYKVLEALIVTLKARINDPSFDMKIVFDSGFEGYIFKFFERFPFNNILHNQLKKYLLIILEKGSEDLINKYFTNNPEFYAFLENLSCNKFINSLSTSKVKKGYVGHIVTLITQLKEKPVTITEKIFESHLIR